MQGKLIVIEGVDGSGKQTQTNLLVERLRKEKQTVATFSFPQYGKKSAGPLEEYLRARKYGDPEKVNPYAASLFYAIDRFDLAEEIKRHLQNGEFVILDRYVDSNAGHQGGKIKDPKERDKFLQWLYDIEYNKLGAPRPDLVIILHVPAEISQRLSKNRGAQDSHEFNLEHLKNAEEAYLWLAQKYPKDHRIIECAPDGKLLNSQAIHAKL